MVPKQAIKVGPEGQQNRRDTEERTHQREAIEAARNQWLREKEITPSPSNDTCEISNGGNSHSANGVDFRKPTNCR